MKPQIVKLLEVNTKEGFMKLQFLILNRLIVDGIFEVKTGKIWLLGDSMAQRVGFSTFMEIAENTRHNRKLNQLDLLPQILNELRKGSSSASTSSRAAGGE